MKDQRELLKLVCSLFTPIAVDDVVKGHSVFHLDDGFVSLEVF